MKIEKTPLISIALTTLVAIAQAQVVNVNLTSNHGDETYQETPFDGTAYSSSIAPIAYTGETWNDILGITEGDYLLDSEGEVTDISFVYSNPDSNTEFDFSHGGGASGLINNYLAPHKNLTAEPDVAPMQITITGLAASGQYDIALISQGDKEGQGGTFTIGDKTLVSLGDAPSNTLIEGSNYVSFTDVAADGLGEITIDWSHNDVNTSFMILNGFQIAAKAPPIEEETVEPESVPQATPTPAVETVKAIEPVASIEQAIPVEQVEPIAKVTPPTKPTYQSTTPTIEVKKPAKTISSPRSRLTPRRSQNRH